MTPPIETNALTPRGNTTSSSNRKGETVGASLMKNVTQVKRKTSEPLEKINAISTEECVSKNITTASERHNVSHVTPLTAPCEPAQTHLSTDITTNQPASESSEVNPSTFLMDRDENSSLVGSGTSILVHKVSELMKSSAETEIVTQIPPKSTQTLSALTTAQSSQTLTMQELTFPLSNLTVRDRVVPSEIPS